MCSRWGLCTYWLCQHHHHHACKYPYTHTGGQTTTTTTTAHHHHALFHHAPAHSLCTAGCEPHIYDYCHTTVCTTPPYVVACTPPCVVACTPPPYPQDTTPVGTCPPQQFTAQRRGSGRHPTTAGRYGGLVVAGQCCIAWRQYQPGRGMGAIIYARGCSCSPVGRGFCRRDRGECDILANRRA